MLEGSCGPVRARLRPDVPSAGHRLPHELYLRSAPVRHGGSGVGGAFRHSRPS
jgi:hypothetical protein